MDSDGLANSGSVDADIAGYVRALSAGVDCEHGYEAALQAGYVGWNVLGVLVVTSAGVEYLRQLG